MNNVKLSTLEGLITNYYTDYIKRKYGLKDLKISVEYRPSFDSYRFTLVEYSKEATMVAWADIAGEAVQSAGPNKLTELLDGTIDDACKRLVLVKAKTLLTRIKEIKRKTPLD